MPPNFAPNKFQERPSGVSRMQELISGRGFAPDHTEGDYSAPAGRVASGKEAGCLLHKNPSPVFGPLGLRFRPFNSFIRPTPNRRLGPSQHDRLDPRGQGLGLARTIMRSTAICFLVVPVHFSSCAVNEAYDDPADGRQ